MKTLYSSGAPVTLSRVLRDHRTALLPLAIVLAVNLVLLLGVVLPLSRRVAANEQRAQAAAQAERDANAESRRAEATREGKARATTDLDMFYRQVLPADVAAARRVVQTKVRILAAEHEVKSERTATDTEEIRDSVLQRFTSTMTLTGDYDDIRAFLYALETAPEFVVIEHITLAEGLESSAPLALGLELSTYYRVPAAESAPRQGSPSSGAGF